MGRLSRTIRVVIIKKKVGQLFISMEHIEIVSKSLRSMAWMFALQGILAVIFGFLIIAYPPLLAVLIGVALIVAGILGVIAAIVVSKFSKIKVAE